MGLYRIRANFFRLGDNEAHFHWQVSWRWVVCSGIDKNFVNGGVCVCSWAFACGLAMDLLVCGIGAAFCGGCAVRDDVLSFA